MNCPCVTGDGPLQNSGWKRGTAKMATLAPSVGRLDTPSAFGNAWGFWESTFDRNVLKSKLFWFIALPQQGCCWLWPVLPVRRGPEGPTAKDA